MIVREGYLVDLFEGREGGVYIYKGIDSFVYTERKIPVL
jgi:hypothetical protein